MRRFAIGSLVLAASLASSVAFAHPTLGGHMERVARPAPDKASIEKVAPQRAHHTAEHRSAPPPTARPSVEAKINPQTACTPGSAGCGGDARSTAHAEGKDAKKLDPMMVRAARLFLDRMKNAQCGARARCE